MKKYLLIIATLIALVGFSPATASANQTDAQNNAQWFVQDPGCGDNTTFAVWTCMDKRWSYESCWYNKTFWDCSGVTWEKMYGVSNDCTWYVHVRNGDIIFWHDLCRKRYGSSRLY